MSTELVKKLHPHEKRIMLTLKNLQSALMSEVARKSGLPEPAVHKASQWAMLKGLVKTTDSSKTRVDLTDEGRRYAREGLPEKRLLSLVSNGRNTLDKLKQDLPELEIGLAWSGKTVKLTALGRNALGTLTPLEKGLNGKPGKNILQELKSRKLATIKETKEKTLTLTGKGRQILPLIKEDKSLGQLKPHHIKTGSWKNSEFRPYDTGLPVPVYSPARLHPYTQFIIETRRKLITMGFREMKGPWAELEFWNMDALYMPQDHPARGIHDVFKLKNPSKGVVGNKRALDRVAKTHKHGWITGSSGWGQWNQDQTLNLVLRSQTTCVSARTLASGVEDPSMYFTLSRVFRPDVIDATHSYEFDQLEGIVIGENLGLRHLMGYLESFGKEIAGTEKIRFRPGYFPFTEPSLEMDGLVKGKWMELVGSGIFRPEVTRPLGVDKPVLAWGMGFARLAMIKMGIKDIRDLFSHDLEWLRGRKIVV
jgi:phenylalanyl-tRNA synthetase alpha chain